MISILKVLYPWHHFLITYNEMKEHLKTLSVSLGKSITESGFKYRKPDLKASVLNWESTLPP